VDTPLPTSSLCTVLLVDDEPVMRLLVRAYLESDGLTVLDEAADGLAGLESFLALNPPPVPTVVVLDNRMPGLTGIEVAERILALHPTQIVVLFSAALDPVIEAKARELGVNACVSKTDTEKLPGIIRSLIAAAG
jgi:CheY-like chemotaxis protein